ncbi:MAG: thiamine-phosphate diphosphorylase [Campylobacteraceae bacterium 4484_4]|nr:MAG: thiamine-phosphate diphosphorylase [Campylobacteraceae bacterium 4484_4]
MLRGLYAITDERLTPLPTIQSQVEAILKGGAKILQFRYKGEITPAVIETADALQHLCRLYRTTFIVNDHIELALKIDADGIHIGKEDADDLSTLRRRLPGKIIGVSCYGEIERAIAAEKAGADYVAFGAFFPSETKPNAKRIDPKILEEAKKHVHLPLCAIGGITVENGAELLRQGADMLSVVGALWRASDPKEEAERFSALFYQSSTRKSEERK